MLSHAAVGAVTPYFADFSQVDFENDYALLWHCGVAPCNLWDGKCECTMDTYFAGGKGVTAGFVMKSGPISIMRIDLVGNHFRIFLQEGEAVPMEKLLKGTYMKAIFAEPVRQVIDKIIKHGIVHHTSVVYGSYVKPFKILAKIKNWEIIT
jgi:L-arabinose isomerase